ncbi:hypothetical protein BJX65DRAFT_313308 [Aspergillus insuetus]
MDLGQPHKPGAAAPKTSKPNKRAGQVCVRCHEKKIRCDVHLQAGTSRRCYNCTVTESDCCIRQSKRAKRERRNSVEGIINKGNKRAKSISKGSRSNSRATISVSDNACSLPLPPVESSSSLLHRHGDVDSPPIASNNNEGVVEDENLNWPTTLYHQTYLGSTGYMDMFSEAVDGRRTPSDTMPLDNGRWWLGVAIRLAEDIGLSQATSKMGVFPGESPGLRRRIWWTLFTQDRIMSLAQGRPCLIHETFCTVPMMTVADFPDPCSPKALIFVHWVKLWAIGGKLHQELNWPRGDRPDKATICEKIIEWAKELPSSLRLPFHLSRTTVFNRDIHDLHLGYFTIIVLLHLERGEHLIPTAAVPAVVAASCIARIFKDFLARGSVQFILPQATWSIALAILALLRARRVPSLASSATEDVEILYTALGRLAPYSNPGKMFMGGIRRIFEQEGAGGIEARPSVPVPGPSLGHHCCSSAVAAESLAVSWPGLFSFITPETTKLVAALLEGWMKRYRFFPILQESVY